jgi:hypothetical protein
LRARCGRAKTALMHKARNDRHLQRIRNLKFLRFSLLGAPPFCAHGTALVSVAEDLKRTAAAHDDN